MDLPTHLLVGAAQRAASEAGAGFYIRHKGDAGRGTILLIVTTQTVTQTDEGCLYRQTLDDQRRGFIELQTGSAAALDLTVAREREWDPDLWVIEIEDKLGRRFFDKIFAASDHQADTI